MFHNLINNKVINHSEYLKEKFNDLLESPKYDCLLTLSWKKGFHDAPGVYLIRQFDEVVYVGETSNIQKRMNDMRNTKNHTVRRNIGNEAFMEEPRFQRATANKSFVPEIELKLEGLMKKSLTIQTLPLELGRKELEEFIMKELSQPKFNIRATKRLDSRIK
ncbi:GIY-YIG nuclease family protein [Psychroflexus sp. CAK1W]|uniref:GIY-YIG nuclease family protein n=1 Tax=Psychroflexus curvus TaxID=2873595 RepID=UPI001CCFA356|nr:GIY-YIG nuclease family protein [Psychroflexus curvus]MBZ9628147.1 GIY-YIG nuclease family protein [Psychroflexus curvus]